MTSMLQNRIPSPLGTPRRYPARSPAPWLEDNQPMTPHPHRPSIDNYITPRKSTTGMHGACACDLSGFSTPQRVTVMGHEHDWVEFRTPQRPTSGTNNWGGASPMLSRNIPKESLMIDYLKFNSLDAADDDDDYGFETGNNNRFDVKRRKRDWVFRKFGWKKNEDKVLGSIVEKKKGSWLSRRWPQGW